MTFTPADERDAASLLGKRPQYLASGATCVVFTDGQRALRLSDPNPGKAARFQIDAQLRTRLRAAGVPTAAVLEVGTLPGGRAYSLDELALGDDFAPSAEGWADLGRALAVLHALPHSGYGLLEDRPDELRGQATTPAQGLHTRCQQVWPFNHQPLAAHPLVWADPDLAMPLAALEGELRTALEHPEQPAAPHQTYQTAVCHTDLHHNQFRWQGGRLVAFMDFGDASAFPPAWDLASVAYFHGWDVAAQVAGTAGLPLGRHAPLLGLLLAFHRASRAVTLTRPGRTAQTVAFARGCLGRLSGG